MPPKCFMWGFSGYKDHRCLGPQPVWGRTLIGSSQGRLFKVVSLTKTGTGTTTSSPLLWRSEPGQSQRGCLPCFPHWWVLLAFCPCLSCPARPHCWERTSSHHQLWSKDFRKHLSERQICLSCFEFPAVRWITLDYTAVWIQLHFLKNEVLNVSVRYVSGLNGFLSEAQWHWCFHFRTLNINIT